MKAPLVVGLLVAAAAVAIAVALPRDEVAGLLDLDAGALPPPPAIALLSPQHGDGVSTSASLAGEATARASEVVDVQYRIDGERWTSIPNIARGYAVVPFSVALELAPGDHLLEARAWDGGAYSHVARALVRRDAPTVHIVDPADGEGLTAGPQVVRGTVVGHADAVHLALGGDVVEATLLPGGVWTATIDVPEGLHRIRATAVAPVASLPAEISVAAAPRAPPSLVILTPREGDSFGELGDPTCVGGCILFSGTSRGAPPIAVDVDGFPAGNASAVASTGTWTFRLPILRVASGVHVATFTPEGGVPRSVTIVARTPRELEVRGDLAPRLSQTNLQFQLVGEGAETADWYADGTLAGHGRAVTVLLDTPGDHALDVRVALPDGRAASASVPLHSLNRAPSVALAEPALVGASIRLVASADDPDGHVVSYGWEFGDGTTATTTAPEVGHRYLERGLHTANVTVVDDTGGTARASTVVVVPNVLPLANFSWEPAHPSVLDVVTFQDTSRDLDGALASRSWSFDEATTSENATPSIRFATRGAHLVTLAVLDELGAEGTLTQVVEVVNLPPTPLFSWVPPIPRAHEEILFVDNSTDPDGPIRTREWSFDDGTTASGPGALHIFRSPGVHHVTLTIVDDLGATANITLPVHVVDSEPTVSAVLFEPARPAAQEAVRFRVLATDRDGGVVALSWDFGDGSNATLLEPVHRYARKGIYAATVTVYDETGLSTVFPFLVDVANAPPTGTIALTQGGYAALPSTLTATASDPDGRIAFYRFDPDGDGLADCETTEPTCEFHYPEARPYLARVWVEDDDGGSIEAQTIVELAAPPSHLAPPRVSIESPTTNGLLRGDHLIRGDATGVRPIAKVELQLRNDTWAYSGSKEPWRLANGGAAWSVLADTRAFADGEYDLVVRATDTGGGEGYARIPVRVLNGARPSDVTLQLLDPQTEITEDAAIRGSAFHPQGVTSVRWRIDDGLWRYVSSSPLAFTIPIDADTLDAGPHLLAIEAYRGPHEKATLDHHFTLANVAPTLIIDDPPAPIAYGLLHATGRILGEGHAEWRIDHHLWRPLPTAPTWNLTEETARIPGGQHTLEIRAASPDGKHASAARSWTIQIVNPPFDTRDDDAPTPTTPPVLEVPGVEAAGALGALAAIALARRRRLT